MPPYGITYFCDDIRFEVQNKFSLIGCYGPDIILGQPPPIVIPKLALLTHIRFPPEPRSAAKIIVYLTDDQPLVLAEWGTEESYTPSQPPNWPPEDEKNLEPQIQRSFIFPMILAPFTILKEGYVRVRLDYRGERIRLGALRVQTIPSATASPLPSGQPPPDVQASS